MKLLRRLLFLLLFISITAFGCLTWVASSRLICPGRRALQDYHREILDHPAEHGMRIANFVAGTAPCLMCEPVPKPGAAAKGNKLRSELAADGLAPPPWGAIVATVVLLHGHNGCKEDHLPVAERFCAVGFRCLLVDLPGHGQHPAPYSCFGVSEAALPWQVLQSAARKFQFDTKPAALFGISQGGAIALQAAARPDENWFAVAEISGFAALDQVVHAQAQRWFHVLARPAEAVVTRLVKLRAGYDPAQIRPIDAAAQLAMPVLIGHGDADTFIPPDQGRQLFQALPEGKKQYLNIPGAKHGTVLITQAPVYATVSRFLVTSLPR